MVSLACIRTDTPSSIARGFLEQRRARIEVWLREPNLKWQTIGSAQRRYKFKLFLGVLYG